MSLQLRSDQVRGFAIATGVLSLVVALLQIGFAHPLALIVIWLLVALGPVGGWIVAVDQHAFPSAFQLLVPATVLCAAPFGLYVWRHGFGWLALSCVFWIATGWVLAVGIWT